MNKKGFTLIELLATILILALLMLVAVPNVMSTIDKNKKDTYIEDAKKMITLAEYEIRSDTSIELPTEGNCIVILLGSLDLTDFNEGPEGGNYNLDESYVVIGRTGNTYEYAATLVEIYDENNKRGINLTTRDELNNANARNKVAKDTELNIEIPKKGKKLNGYTISEIIDS